jgi:hypothetical protein
VSHAYTRWNRSRILQAEIPVLMPAGSRRPAVRYPWHELVRRCECAPRGCVFSMALMHPQDARSTHREEITAILPLTVVYPSEAEFWKHPRKALLHPSSTRNPIFGCRPPAHIRSRLQLLSVVHPWPLHTSQPFGIIRASVRSPPFSPCFSSAGRSSLYTLALTDGCWRRMPNGAAQPGTRCPAHHRTHRHRPHRLCSLCFSWGPRQPRRAVR